MIEFSECDRHDIGHAKWMVERATPGNPEVCFDYTLVANLLNIIERLTAAAEVGPDFHTIDGVVWTTGKHIQQDTIERCAQIATDFIISMGNSKSGVIKIVPYSVAVHLGATIRTLKDEK